MSAVWEGFEAHPDDANLKDRLSKLNFSEDVFNDTTWSFDVAPQFQNKRLELSSTHSDATEETSDITPESSLTFDSEISSVTNSIQGGLSEDFSVKSLSPRLQYSPIIACTGSNPRALQDAHFAVSNKPNNFLTSPKQAPFFSLKAQALKEKRCALESWYSNKKLESLSSSVKRCDSFKSEDDISASGSNMERSSLNKAPRRKRASARLSFGASLSKKKRHERERSERMVERLRCAEEKLRDKDDTLRSRIESQRGAIPCMRRYRQAVQHRAENTLRLTQLETARHYFERRLQRLQDQAENVDAIPVDILKVVSAIPLYQRHTLKEDLDRALAELYHAYPVAPLKAMFQETRQLQMSGIAKRALQAGQSWPKELSFLALDTSDQLLDLQKQRMIRRTGPNNYQRMVVVFYLGNWSSLCLTTLKMWNKYQDNIERQGFSLVAVGCESFEHLKGTAVASGTTFRLFSDPRGSVAKRLGLWVERESPIPGQNPSDLPTDPSGARPTTAYPIAATYVVDAKGYVSFAHVDADHTQRAEPSDVLSALMEEMEDVPLESDVAPRRGLLRRK